MAILQELQRKIQQRRNELWIGRTDEVLVEGRREKFNQWIGRTTQNRVLNFSDPDGLATGDLRGAYCRARVTQAGPNSLSGELIGIERPAPAFQALRVLQ